MREFHCSEQPCESNKHEAKGMCRLHYRRTIPRTPDKPVIRQCIVCGKSAVRAPRANHVFGATCSNDCRRVLSHGDRCEIPSGHWARIYGTHSSVYIKRCKQCTRAFTARQQSSAYCSPGCRERKRPALPRFTAGRCKECDQTYIAEVHGSHVSYCSPQCSKRVGRRARRAREHEAAGTYRFSQIMRQYAQQGRKCAYCKQPALGLPDPEHVLALSRGGCNDMSNLVASCRSCNTDKGDLTLDEWRNSRVERHLPPVDTRLDGEAYHHLYVRPPTSVAWRDKGRVSIPRDMHLRT